MLVRNSGVRIVVACTTNRNRDQGDDGEEWKEGAKIEPERNDVAGLAV
jgi:hypothetical protein